MEIYKDIIGYEGYYQISNKCNVRSLDRVISNGKGRIGTRLFKGKVLSTSKDDYGYQTVRLSKKGETKTFRLHTLIWKSFNGYVPKNKVIDHIDDNPSNNLLCNLQLLSHRENIIKGTVKKRSIHSQYPNVSFRHDRGKYFGRLQVRGKSVMTGCFDNDLDAYNSVLKYRKENNIQ